MICANGFDYEDPPYPISPACKLHDLLHMHESRRGDEIQELVTVFDGET